MVAVISALNQHKRTMNSMQEMHFKELADQVQAAWVTMGAEESLREALMGLNGAYTSA